MSSPDAGPVLDELFQQVQWLNVYLRIYVELYVKDPATVDALNRRTGHINGLMQLAFRDSLVIRVARVLDNEKVAGRITGSFATAIEELGLGDSDPRYVRIVQAFTRVKRHADSIIKYRHQRLAHIDKALLDSEDGGPRVFMHQLRRAVQGITALLNRVWMLKVNGGVAFMDQGDEKHAVATLRRIIELGTIQLDAERAEKRGSHRKMEGS